MARTWQVTGQDPITLTGPHRGERGVRVTFKDSSGLVDHVDVPNSEYPARVSELVTARIREHEAVAGMTGSTAQG